MTFGSGGRRSIQLSYWRVAHQDTEPTREVAESGLRSPLTFGIHGADY